MGVASWTHDVRQVLRHTRPSASPYRRLAGKLPAPLNVRIAAWRRHLVVELAAVLREAYAAIVELHLGNLIEPVSLANQRDDPTLRIIDCCKPGEYEHAHIPGAIHISTDYWLKSPDRNGQPRGEHLMDRASLEALLGRLGLDYNSTVVAYDDNGSRAAARFWWVLRYLGHQNVSVLNGGWRAWVHEGLPVSCLEPAAPVAIFESQPNDNRRARLSDVVAAVQSGETQLLDARSLDEWNGWDLHGNRRGGHIPGAVRLEWTRLVLGKHPRRFLPPDRIHDIVLEVGINVYKPIIVYCQGGVRASHVAFGLELIGCRNVRVYDGSMREWANRDDTPLEVA